MESTSYFSLVKKFSTNYDSLSDSLQQKFENEHKEIASPDQSLVRFDANEERYYERPGPIKNRELLSSNNQGILIPGFAHMLNP